MVLSTFMTCHLVCRINIHSRWKHFQTWQQLALASDSILLTRCWQSHPTCRKKPSSWYCRLWLMNGFYSVWTICHMVFFEKYKKIVKPNDIQTCRTSVGWHKWTMWHIASHPFVIVLCTKLDAECDWQETVVGRLLTTLGDDRHDIMKLFLVHRLGKALGESCLLLDIFKFRICLTNILQLRGLCFLDQLFWSTEGMTSDPMH